MMTQLLQTGSPNMLITGLIGWLVMVNLLAFAALLLDQRRALAGQGAMPETSILLLAILGGWPGAQLGRLCFQAQERERAFGLFLNLSALPILIFAAVLESQDMDWPALAAKAQQMIAAQTGTQSPETPVAEEKAPAPPAVVKPPVKSIGKTPAPKQASVTGNPDLPKRFGPSSKKAAWQSR